MGIVIAVVLVDTVDKSQKSPYVGWKARIIPDFGFATDKPIHLPCGENLEKFSTSYPQESQFFEVFYIL